MSISLLYCQVTVTDPDESIAFYRDALGYEVTQDVASGEFRWVTLAAPDGSGARLVLSEPHAGRSQADGDAMEGLLAKGSLPILVFTSDDVDQAFERARTAGAEVLQEPVDQPWGPRDCAFRDPSGNTIRINQVQAA